MKPIQQHIGWILAALFVFIGLMLLAKSRSAYNEQQLKEKKYERTFARVIEVKIAESGNFYPVLGFFSLDSQKVITHARHEVGKLKDYEVGNVFEIYYDIINRDDVEIIRNEWFGAVFFSISGSVLCMVALLLAYREWYKKHQWQKLLDEGHNLETEIKWIARDLQILIDNQPAYVVFCEWQSPNEPLAYAFKSEPLSFDPTPFLPANNKLSVMIDPKNPRSYYVDVQGLKQARFDEVANSTRVE
jgi:hypothetical protein